MSDKLALTIVMPSAHPTGGAEEALLQLLKSESARHRLRVQLIFLENGTLIEVCRPLVEEVHTVTCGRTRQLHKWWLAAGEIGQHAVRFGATLIFGWMTKGHVYGGLAGWRVGISAAWYQMGLPENGFLDRVSRVLPTRFVLGCSEFVRTRQQNRQRRTKVLSVPLSVDTQRFSSQQLPTLREARAKLNLPSDCTIIGIVGRLQSWKGMHVLLRAMPLVLAEYPSAICLVVGGAYPAEPNYSNYLESLAQELELKDSVVFAGAQCNVPLWMQAMDIFVHASKEEPFGIVVLEAMALGKPVIATIPGGPEEVIQPDVNGWFCQFEHHEQLAEQIKQILEYSPDRLDVIRVNAANTAQVFSSERYASLFVNTVLSQQ